MSLQSFWSGKSLKSYQYACPQSTLMKLSMPGVKKKFKCGREGSEVRLQDQVVDIPILHTLILNWVIRHYQVLA